MKNGELDRFILAGETDEVVFHICMLILVKKGILQLNYY